MSVYQECLLLTLMAHFCRTLELLDLDSRSYLRSLGPTLSVLVYCAGHTCLCPSSYPWLNMLNPWPGVELIQS